MKQGIFDKRLFKAYTDEKEYNDWNWNGIDVVNAHMSSLIVKGFVEKNKKQTSFGMLPLINAENLKY